MESPDYPPSDVDASRPSLGFPLGTALLLLVIFSLSGIFSCCYHWDKLRRRISLSDSHHHHYDLESDIKPSNNKAGSNQQGQIQSLPVLMPGDDVPKFIALPCPCEPLRPDQEKQIKFNNLQYPPTTSKPPRIAVPLY